MLLLVLLSIHDPTTITSCLHPRLIIRDFKLVFLCHCTFSRQFSLFMIKILLFYHAERSESKFGRFLAFVVIAVVVGAGLAGYVFYKYRLRVSLIHSQLQIMLYIVHIKLEITILNYLCLCFCSHTWTLRSWLSCHNTCHWTSKIM